MFKIVLSALLVILLLSSCNSSDQSTVATVIKDQTISGYVIDDPVIGATIEVYNGNTLIVKEENATDIDGHFSINLDQDYTQIRIFEGSDLLYTINKDVIEKDEIISPLLLLKKELGTHYPSASHPALHIAMLNKLKELLNYTQNDPQQFNALIENANKDFLAQQLEAIDTTQHNVQCFENNTTYPLHITCFADDTISWSENNTTLYQGKTFSYDLNSDTTIQMRWSDGYMQNKTIDKYYIHNQQQRTISASTEENISIDLARVDIPANSFDNDINLTVSLLSYSADDSVEPEYALEVTPANNIEVSKEPVKITIPLSDKMYNLAVDGRLKIAKTDVFGTTLLDPIIDDNNKTASVEVTTFSLYKPIEYTKNVDYDTFISALKSDETNAENKTFYDVLYDNSDETTQELLALIKDEEIDASDVLNSRLDNGTTTLASALVTLYNQLIDIQNDYSNDYPAYINMMYKIYGNDAQYDKILRDTLNSLDQFFQLGEDISIDKVFDFSINLNGTTYKLPVSSLAWGDTIYTRYRDYFSKYVLQPIDIFKNVIVEYKDPWYSAVQGIEALNWIEASYMALPNIVGSVFDGYRDAQVSALRKTIDTIQEDSYLLYNEEINLLMNYIDNNIGQPQGDATSWWNDVMQIDLRDVGTAHFAFNEEKQVLECGTYVKIDKNDFLLMYMLHQKYDKSHIEGQKEFLNQTIALVMQIIKLRMEKGIENTVKVSYVYKEDGSQRETLNSNGGLKEHFYITDNTTILFVQPQEDYYLKDVTFVFLDNQENEIGSIDVDKIDASGYSVTGAAINSSLDKETAVHIIMKGKLYSDGYIYDEELMNYTYDDVIEITKLANRIELTRSDAYDNMQFSFPSLKIDEYGKALLTMQNKGDLQQFGKVYFDADFNFVIDGNTTFTKHYTATMYDGFNKDLSLGFFTQQEATALKNAQTITLNMSASFVFNDPKLLNTLTIDKNDYGTIPFAIDSVTNNYTFNPYLFNIEQGFVIGTEDQESISNLIFTKVYADVIKDNRIFGVLEIIKDNVVVYNKSVVLDFYKDNGFGDLIPSTQATLQVEPNITQDGIYIVRFSAQGAVSEKQITIGQEDTISDEQTDQDILQSVTNNQLIQSVSDVRVVQESDDTTLQFTVLLKKSVQSIKLITEDGIKYDIYDKDTFDFLGMQAGDEYTSTRDGVTFAVQTSTDMLTWGVSYTLDAKLLQDTSFTIEVTDEEGITEKIVKTYTIDAQQESIQIESAYIRVLSEDETSVVYKMVIETSMGIDGLQLESSYENRVYTIIDDGKLTEKPDFISYITPSYWVSLPSHIEIVFVVQKSDEVQDKWFKVNVSGDVNNSSNFAVKTLTYEVPAL